MVTGQVQHTQVNSNQSGNPTLAALHLDTVKTHTNETTTVEDRKEWRITFRRSDAPAAPPGLIQTGAIAPATPPAQPGLPSQPVPLGQ